MKPNNNIEIKKQAICPECGSDLIHMEGCLICPCCGWTPCEPEGV